MKNGILGYIPTYIIRLWEKLSKTDMTGKMSWLEKGGATGGN